MMETDEITKLDEIRALTKTYLKTLKPDKKGGGIYTTEIRVFSYAELSLVAFNMLKACILALNQDDLKISKTVRNNSIDVPLILEIVAQLFPLAEMEFLDEVRDMLAEDRIKKTILIPKEDWLWEVSL